MATETEAEAEIESLPLRRVGRLEDWATNLVPTTAENPYLPPEQRVRVLTGKTFGHPEFPDGHAIQTNRIVAAAGRFVTTDSGSIYELGAVNPKYLAWIAAEGHEWDDENPVRIYDAD